MADSVYGLDPAPSKVTRVRPQLSCIPCRQGKLKCNRVQPACDQCLKRSREAACNYVPPPPKDRGRKAKDMRGRIKHLESLVVDLMNGKAPPQQPQPPPDAALSAGTSPDHGQGAREVAPGFTGDVRTPHSGSADDDGHCASAFGQMRISEEETTYTGSSHWTAILHDISEVKTILEAEEGLEDNGATGSERSEENRSHSALIVGSPPTVSREELLNSMPPKATADRLVALWYSSQDPILPLLHGPTFQAHYRQFWKHPYSTSGMFIALLYGILSLATIYSHRGASSGPTLSSDAAVRDANRYRTLAASAAVLADYAKPKPYTLETLLIYAESEFLCGSGTPMEVWLIMGVIVRLALRMGYHRDPSHYGNISPFDGEMRRRVWHLTWQLDVLLSFTLGLPSTVRGFQSDAEPPRNLLDQDFSVDSRELPPPRAPTELTPVSYCLAKTRVCAVFAAAADASHSVTAPTYPEIMELDRRLEEAHGLVPPALRLRPLDQALSDPQELIMHRFNVELLYQKTRCVLHRTYLVKAHDESRFQHSRTACLDAATKLLHHQGTIFHACQPGGQLSRVKWYFSSLTSHDFLLAAMVVCLELNLRHESRLHPPDSQNSPKHSQVEDTIGTDELLKALETSSSIWDSYEAKLIDSGEAKKAAKAFRAILAKLKSTHPTTPFHNHHQTNYDTTTTYVYPSTSAPAPSAAHTHTNPFPPHLHIPPATGPGAGPMNPESASFIPVSSAAAAAAGLQPTPDPMNHLGSMLDMPLDINWDLWDKNAVTYGDFMADMNWQASGAGASGPGPGDPSAGQFGVGQGGHGHVSGSGGGGVGGGFGFGGYLG